MERFEAERQRRLQETQELTATKLKQRHDAILASFRAGKDAYAEWEEACKEAHQQSIDTFKANRQREAEFEASRAAEEEKKLLRRKQAERDEANASIADVEHTLRRIGRDGSEDTGTAATGNLQPVKVDPQAYAAMYSAIHKKKEEDDQARRDRQTRLFRMESEQARLGAEILRKREFDSLLAKARAIGLKEREVAFARRQHRVQKIIHRIDQRSVELYHENRIKTEAAEEDQRFAVIAAKEREVSNQKFAVTKKEFDAKRDAKDQTRRAENESFCRLAVEQLVSLSCAVIDRNTETLSDGAVLYRSSQMPVSTWRQLSSQHFSGEAFEQARLRLQKQAAKERAGKKKFGLGATMALNLSGNEDLISSTSPRSTNPPKAFFEGDGSLGSLPADSRRLSGPPATIVTPPSAAQTAGNGTTTTGSRDVEPEGGTSMDLAEFYLHRLGAIDGAKTATQVEQSVNRIIEAVIGTHDDEKLAADAIVPAAVTLLHGAGPLSSLALLDVNGANNGFQVLSYSNLKETAVNRPRSQSRGSQRDGAQPSGAGAGGKKAPPAKKSDRVSPDMAEGNAAAPDAEVDICAILADRVMSHIETTLPNRIARQESIRREQKRLEIIEENKHREEEGEELEPVPAEEPLIAPIQPLVLTDFPCDDPNFATNLRRCLDLRAANSTIGDLPIDSLLQVLIVADHPRTVLRRLQEAVTLPGARSLPLAEMSLFHQKVAPPAPGAATAPAKFSFPELHRLIHTFQEKKENTHSNLSRSFVTSEVNLPHFREESSVAATIQGTLVPLLQISGDDLAAPSEQFKAAVQSLRGKRLESHRATTVQSLVATVFPPNSKQVIQNRLRLVHHALRENEVRLGVLIRRYAAETIYYIGTTFEDYNPSAVKQDLWSYCDKQRQRDIEIAAATLKTFTGKLNESYASLVIAVATLATLCSQQLLDSFAAAYNKEDQATILGSVVPLPDLAALRNALQQRDADVASTAVESWARLKSDLHNTLYECAKNMLEDVPSVVIEQFFNVWEHLLEKLFAAGSQQLEVFLGAVKTITGAGYNWRTFRYIQSVKGSLPRGPCVVRELLSTPSVLSSTPAAVAARGSGLDAGMHPFHLEYLLSHIGIHRHHRTVAGAADEWLEQCVGFRMAKPDFIHAILSAQTALLGFFIEVGDDDDADEAAQERYAKIRQQVPEELVFLPEWWSQLKRPAAGATQLGKVDDIPLLFEEDVAKVFDQWKGLREGNSTAESQGIPVRAFLVQLVTGNTKPKVLAQVSSSSLAAARNFSAQLSGFLKRSNAKISTIDEALGTLIPLKDFTALPWWFSVENREMLLSNIHRILQVTGSHQGSATAAAVLRYACGDLSTVKVLEKAVACLNEVTKALGLTTDASNPVAAVSAATPVASPSQVLALYPEAFSEVDLAILQNDKPLDTPISASGMTSNHWGKALLDQGPSLSNQDVLFC
jgi:hypothetical protein